MQVQTFRQFSPKEHHTWQRMFEALEPSRRDQAHPTFQAGIDKLGITAAAIPDLNQVNERLLELTGWRGVPVTGLEDDASFFAALARREFPVGNFIRDAGDLGYTPAPDIFHDLYGHLPLFADSDYADFCYEFGVRASRYRDRPELLKQFGRLFWFGVEFPLCLVNGRRRIFGGGILSSRGECDYSLSAEPEIVPFDLEIIRRQPYYIDDFQSRIFLIDRPEDLYNCLPAFELGLRPIAIAEELPVRRRVAWLLQHPENDGTGAYG